MNIILTKSSLNIRSHKLPLAVCVGLYIVLAVFQGCMVLLVLTKEYFLTCLLFSVSNFPIMMDHVQIVWLLQ
jgi:hypothetical protein